MDAIDTQEFHSIEKPDGSRAYTSDRLALHEKIMDEIIVEQGATPTTGKPQALFMGGGTACRKLGFRESSE